MAKVPSSKSTGHAGHLKTLSKSLVARTCDSGGLCRALRQSDRKNWWGLYSGGCFFVLFLTIISAIGACSTTHTSIETDNLSVSDIAVLFTQTLTPTQVDAYEQQLVDRPGDITTRTKLLVHYYREGVSDRAAERKQGRHLVWMIQHAPNSSVLEYGVVSYISPHSNPEGFVDAKRAWEDQVERNPSNADFLGRFAEFIQFSDKDRSIELLLKAQELESESVVWAVRLGTSYLQLVGWPEWKKDHPNAAEDALVQFNRAYDHANPEQIESIVLGGRAKSAFFAGHYDLAATYANEMLDAADAGSSLNRGNLIHQGHMILGRIAVAREDVARAKVHLLESGKSPASPTMSSFGPNMALALDLLERGEFDIVSEYFELCSVFWQRPKLEEWKLEVKSGRIPDFGANLVY